MKKIYFSLLFLVAATMVSCDKYLDIKPKGYTIPYFFDDYVKLIDDQSFYRVSSAYPNYLTDDVNAGIASDVNKSANYTNLSQYKKNIYTFVSGQVFLPGETDPMYEPAYAHIYTYNVIINNVLNVPDASDADKKRIKAEAQVGRAFEYLVLVNAYAEHYDPATASTALGVPLVLSEDINVGYTRNTVAEVYAQIKKDLDEALPNLGTVVPNNFHPLKSVGYAFLSRMYLYMGNYQEALTNSKEALKLNSYLTDFNLYTTKLSTTFGRVCLITDNLVGFPNADKNKESIWIRLGSASSSALNGEVYASSDLLSVYSQDLATGATDKRRTLFFLDGSAKFGTGTAVSFPGRVLWGPYVDQNYGLSSSEIYLTAAECEARIGDKNAAMQYLNTLRNSRIANNKPLTAATNDEALAIALRERRREMPYLGCTRLVDLKRLNKDPRFAKSITHIQGTDTYTLQANDKRLILPLPPKVIDYNPSLPQYER
jgi:starch-binding outer membrane protein, SusD/RagB family